MRLTLILLGNCNRYILRFKNAWKLQGHRKIIENPIPKLLIEKGVPIIDALKLVEPAPANLERIEIPKPWRPPQPLDKTHPNWNAKVCHQYRVETRVAEGLLQAQLLTKTVVHEGLPKQIEDLVGIADQEDQDVRVKRLILNSQIYDAVQLRLPKIIDFSRPGFNFPRVYGIPLTRKLQLLLRYLWRLADSQTGIYQGSLQRSIFTKPECVITTTKNNDLLQFKLQINHLVTAKEPLEPFASMEEVAKVNSEELPDLYPVKYTIDLIKLNVYERYDFFPVNKTFSNPHVHTLYLPHPYMDHQWSLSQKRAKALISCYTAAASQAKLLYGNIQDLPKPVAVQCILTNGPVFTLVAYQLNTLNLDDNNGSRNIAWFAPEMKMYDICKEENGKVHFEGYNPEVYKWILAMNLNGLTLGQPLSMSHLMPTLNAAVSSAQLDHV